VQHDVAATGQVWLAVVTPPHQGIPHDPNKCSPPVHPGYGPAICRGFFDAYAGQSTALILLQAFRRLVEVPPPGAAGPGQAVAGQGRAPGADRAAGDTGEEPAPGRW